MQHSRGISTIFLFFCVILLSGGVLLVPLQSAQAISTGGVFSSIPNTTNTFPTNPISISTNGNTVTYIDGSFDPGYVWVDSYLFSWSGADMTVTETGKYNPFVDVELTLINEGTTPMTHTGPEDLTLAASGYDFGYQGPGNYILQVEYVGVEYVSDPPYELGFNGPISDPVPEPCTLLLAGSSLAGLAAYRRRFKKA
ncbi:MAG TPA: PEP-CTERM sorting domain-containing protein [Syntrophobacteraceae bacterium]|nr:PEP-CTERM sorting domain-containing protein [Syntrophobacteraceae bacterium]